MKEQSFLQSVLLAKSKPGNEQELFAVFAPDNNWLANMPHKFVGDAEVSGSVVYKGNKAYVSATVRVPMQYVCDRCGESFSKNLLTSAEAVYSEVEEYESLSDIELEQKIVSNRVNLLPMVRDAVIDAVPSQVLCKESCKGLCPVCGENLNFSSCRCKK